MSETGLRLTNNLGVHHKHKQERTQNGLREVKKTRWNLDQSNKDME